MNMFLFILSKSKETKNFPLSARTYISCLFKDRGVVYINLPPHSTLSLYGDGRVYLLMTHGNRLS